ncbi:FAD dependent oxidoreductase [Tangfeifania diversioriginum]|uniref:FAD dependent oxidoreductase n=1 Tax=Tangfeifania diversioriginum TaxID=1168035 RepID=A0A1M6PN84_9BACT|nr:FAD-dependent oxidoreductase [Tangfeifania diversioriginum]SHK09414.1 FAD dependent oxidoreductase [Tangfeifania diversioriginum]
MYTLQTDVLVVGSGAAGITAAISSARNGANTLLVESSGFLGGLSTILPWLGFHDRDYRQVVKGIAHEYVMKLHKNGDSSGYVYDPKCSSLVSVNGHSWKILAMQLAQDAGVKIMLHTYMVDTVRENDRITGIIVENKTGRQKINAKVVIDCSGDGDVAARGNVKWEKGRTSDGLVQAPTLVFRIGNLNRSKFVDACKNNALNYREWLKPYPELLEKMQNKLDSSETFIIGGFASLVEKAREDGVLDIPQTRVVGVKLHLEDKLLIVMTRILGLNPVDVESISTAYSRIYSQIPQIMYFFKHYVPGCENILLDEIAPMLGIRESRRIVGDYILTADDLTEGRVFNDTVCMGGYHIDIHRPSGSWVESKNVKAYTIPLRSLIAANVEGLMMAGKCISATHEAIASTRVIPICMGQGEAVGTVAAMAIKNKKSIRDVSIKKVQEQLNKQGVEFGQSLGAPNYKIINELGQLPLVEPPTDGEKDEATSANKHWIK